MGWLLKAWSWLCLALELGTLQTGDAFVVRSCDRVTTRATQPLTQQRGAPSGAFRGVFDDALNFGAARAAMAMRTDDFATPVKLRDVQYDELAEASSLLVTSFFERESHLFAFHAVRASRELGRLRENHGSNKHVQLLARSGDGAAVGYVDLDLRPLTGARNDASKFPRPYLSDLAVRPDFRRRGIAMRLVQRCEQAALARGGVEIFLQVETSNVPALAMYAKLGYDVWRLDSLDEKVMLRKPLWSKDGPGTLDDESEAPSLLAAKGALPAE